MTLGSSMNVQRLRQAAQEGVHQNSLDAMTQIRMFGESEAERSLPIQIR
jgi:hypothetical protein